MIVPSKKLKQFVDLYGSREVLCEKIGLAESMLSDLMNRKRGATSRTIEKFYLFNAIPLSEAWDIVEGEDGKDA